MKFYAPLLAASLAVATLPAIEVEGNAFWDSKSGDRFYIRGVDYQPMNNGTLIDPLADEDVCLRDIEHFKDLGLNTVRVYTVDNSQEHDVCMKALDAAGIYLILDVNTPEASISRSQPKCSYNAAYLQSVFATVDVFAAYDNVLGFFAGNEVINDMENTTIAAPYVKAVVRDMKKYMRSQNYRAIPVGYSAADVTANVLDTADYFNCGDDADARIDMLGVNDYSWCGHSSFVVSGYKEKVARYSGYSLPIFFSEYGCNTVGTSRLFTEVGTIYSTQMTGVFSGGLVYEYSEEANNYGLVEIDDNGNVTTLADFAALKSQLNATSNPAGNGGYSSSNNYSSCPAYEPGTWEANATLPDVPDAASIFFKSGAGEPLGTDIGNTQWGCYDASSNEVNSSSSSSVAKSTSTAASSSSSASATASSVASSSSKALGNAVAVPFVFNMIHSFVPSTIGSILGAAVFASGLIVIA